MSKKRVQKPSAPAGPVCQRCNEVIVAGGGLTAEQIAARTTKNYGRPLCATCGIFERNGIEEWEVECG